MKLSLFRSRAERASRTGFGLRVQSQSPKRSTLIIRSWGRHRSRKNNFAQKNCAEKSVTKARPFSQFSVTIFSNEKQKPFNDFFTSSPHDVLILETVEKTKQTRTKMTSYFYSFWKPANEQFVRSLMECHLLHFVLKWNNSNRLPASSVLFK